MNFKLSEPRFKKHKVQCWNGKYVTDLDNISVDLLQYTPYEKLKSFIPELVTATWNEDIAEFRKTVTDEDKDKIMSLTFAGKVIPTALKSIPITILLKGISGHDVTHIIRHSGLSFAADCTGDKYIMNRPMLIPSFMQDMPESYKNRYIECMKHAFKLYDDICNNFADDVHIQDARLVLPRMTETFYYITGSLYDFLRLIEQRIDMQVQPKSDNIIALRIYEKLVSVYPLDINVDRRNSFYCNESEHPLSSKWYSPLPQNKTTATEKMQTVYGDMTKMRGYRVYEKLANKIKESINAIKNRSRRY